MTGCLFKNKIALISSIAAHAHSLYPWPSMSHAILCVTNVNIVVIIIVHLFEKFCNPNIIISIALSMPGPISFSL